MGAHNAVNIVQQNGKGVPFAEKEAHTAKGVTKLTY